MVVCFVVVFIGSLNVVASVVLVDGMDVTKGVVVVCCLEVSVESVECVLVVACVGLIVSRCIFVVLGAASVDINLEVGLSLVVLVCMMGFGCFEIVVFVVLDIGGSGVVVSVIVGKVEGGKILVKVCVVAVVNARDVG